MSWEIRVLDIQGNVLRTFIDGINPDTGEVGVEQILTATVDPPFGDCKELQFTGRNDVLQADARNIIQYLEDHNPVFWGPLIVYPSPATKGAGPNASNEDALNVFVVAGGSHLLERSVVGPKVYNQDLPLDVAVQARMMGEDYGHPALIWDANEMPLCGWTSNLLASPHRNLRDVYDEFLKIVPNSHYGVDGQGRVFFKVIT